MGLGGRIVKKLLVCMALLGCSGAQEPETQAEPRAEAEPQVEAEPAAEPQETEMPTQAADHIVDDAGIRWRLRAEPARVSMAERDSVRLTIEATNTTDAQIDPERHRGQWLFQGEPHMGLMNWFGNGLRPMEWSGLPPGQTVTDAREPGEHLFEAPGEYEVAYARDGRRTAVRVTITE